MHHDYTNKAMKRKVEAKTSGIGVRIEPEDISNGVPPPPPPPSPPPWPPPRRCVGDADVAAAAFVACGPSAEATNVSEEFMAGTLVVVAASDATDVVVVKAVIVDLVVVDVDRCVLEVAEEDEMALSVDEAAVGTSELE